MIEFYQNVMELKNIHLILITVVSLVLHFLVKAFFIKKVNKTKNLKAFERMTYIKNVKTYSNILFFIFLVALWSAQIQTLFVSMVAVAAALVLATKEMIMSIMGGVFIRMNQIYRVGDRIEVDGVRGFVVERSFTVTKILEIGPEHYSQQTTGNLIALPNSLMLSKAVLNESYFKDYSIKSFIFPLPKLVPMEQLEEKILAWAHEICEPYIKDAEKFIGQFCKKEGLLIPAILPRIKISIKKDEFELILKMPVENHKIGDVEQLLLRKFAREIQFH